MCQVSEQLLLYSGRYYTFSKKMTEKKEKITKGVPSSIPSKEKKENFCSPKILKSVSRGVLDPPDSQKVVNFFKKSIFSVQNATLSKGQISNIVF